MNSQKNAQLPRSQKTCLRGSKIPDSNDEKVCSCGSFLSWAFCETYFSEGRQMATFCKLWFNHCRKVELTSWLKNGLHRLKSNHKGRSLWTTCFLPLGKIIECAVYKNFPNSNWPQGMLRVTEQALRSTQQSVFIGQELNVKAVAPCTYEGWERALFGLWVELLRKIGFREKFDKLF